jgi:glutamate synthase (NADPH/NADH) small chain
MADPKGFMTTPRETPKRRPVDVRIQDWREVYTEFERGKLEKQAGRCMDCGIPFCHHGCPLGNLIPEWNDLVWRHDWYEAAERLHATNNFPEFTGRLCPAPCEESCVLGINADPVTIKQVEVEIINRAWDEGWVQPRKPATATGKKAAVIGSGPAGLAAAQQLTRAGHEVTVYERADRIGGLLRYGIPEFKMEKQHLDRRLAQMEAEGTVFRCGMTAGEDVTAGSLRAAHDAIVLAGGSTVARELRVPGRELDGVHQAMEYLPLSNRVTQGDLAETPISARGKNVVIIGGGDTGADCLGTAHRQGAASVTQLEILPRPPGSRPESQPWPTYPMVYRVSSAHEEGGDRVYSVSTEEFLGDPAGHVRALRLVEVEMADGRPQPVQGSEREIPCELVLLAMGFTGPERSPLLTGLGVEFTERGNVARDAGYATSVPGVFAAGDMGRGQSLIVWAIAEGRSAAAAVDRYLNGASGPDGADRPARDDLESPGGGSGGGPGGGTVLPTAIPATARPLS